MHRASRDRDVLALCLALLVVLLLAGCQSYTGYLITGESLDAAGKAFVQVGQEYNKQIDAKRITPEQYKAWAQFATKFKTAYPASVQLWKSAVTVNDAALTKQSQAIITALVGELAKFGAVVGYQIAGS